MGIRDEQRNYWDSKYWGKITFNDGLVEGTTYGVFTRGAAPEFNGGEIKTTSTNRDQYALYLSRDYSNGTRINGTFINAPNASGIYLGGNTAMTSGRIYAGNKSAYGVYQEGWTFTMNGGTIETPGTNAISIVHDRYDSAFEINDGEITSGNIGIYASSWNNYSRNERIYGGSITSTFKFIYKIYK